MTSSLVQGSFSDFQTEYEYSTQFFGFTTKIFCNGVYNAMVMYMSDAFNFLLPELQKLSKPENADSMKQACIEAHRKTVLSVDKYFDILERYLEKSLFSVPKHVLLEEDSIHGIECTDTLTEEEDLDKAIEKIIQKILKLKHDSNELLEASQKSLICIKSLRQLSSSVPDVSEKKTEMLELLEGTEKLHGQLQEFMKYI